MNQAVGNHAIKEFFSDEEWDLIYALVENNAQFCDDDESDPKETYDSIVSKIYNLFQTEGN